MKVNIVSYLQFPNWHSQFLQVAKYNLINPSTMLLPIFYWTTCKFPLALYWSSIHWHVFWYPQLKYRMTRRNTLPLEFIQIVLKYDIELFFWIAIGIKFYAAKKFLRSRSRDLLYLLLFLLHKIGFIKFFSFGKVVEKFELCIDVNFRFLIYTIRIFFLICI